MMHIEKLKECPDCCEVTRWNYDGQKCGACGHGVFCEVHEPDFSGDLTINLAPKRPDDLASRASRAMHALRTPERALERVPGTIRNSIADIISDLLDECGQKP